MPDVVSGDESAEPLIANGSEPSDEGQGRVTGSDDGIAASGVDAAESSSDDIPAGESSLGDGGTRTDSTPGSLSSLFRAASTDEPAAENFSPADGRETTEQLSAKTEVILPNISTDELPMSPKLILNRQDDGFDDQDDKGGTIRAAVLQADATAMIACPSPKGIHGTRRKTAMFSLLREEETVFLQSAEQAPKPGSRGREGALAQLSAALSTFSAKASKMHSNMPTPNGKAPYSSRKYNVQHMKRGSSLRRLSRSSFLSLSIAGKVKQSTSKTLHEVKFSLPEEKSESVWMRTRGAFTEIWQFTVSVWVDIKALLMVYEVLAIPLRLVILNRTPTETVVWLLEARQVILPALDLVADAFLVCDAVVTAYRKYQEAKKDEQEKDTLGNRVANIKFITKNQNPFQKVPWAAWINSYTVLHIMVVWLYWLVVINRIPIYVFWGCQLLRLPIISALVSYFKFKELQPNVNVSTISAFKFVLLIFLFTHYVGLVFYFLCLVVGFDANLETQSWVVQFEVNNFLPVQLSPTLTANVYFMCIYKGLNSLTNLGFEGIVPRRMEELLCGIVTFMMQIVVEAYILGTLTHYLVKRDPLDEQFLSFMQVVDQYCKGRNLPTEMHTKLQSFFEFQYQQQKHDTTAITKYLPHTTRVALAHQMYGSVLERNRFLFRNTNPQFTTMMLMELREEFLMPGGVVFLEGDMARDLYFAVQGDIERIKDGKVIGVLYGEQDGVNALGDVAFIMGLPHSFAAKARTTGSATLLTITSAVFDKLLAPFPESKEQITGNLLEEYDMDRQGRVVHQEKQSLDEQTRKERREIINMIQSAIKMGKMDEARSMLTGGFDVNTVDYDGRAILHVAAAAGDMKLVEMLVKEYDAPVSALDKGGRSALDDAMDRGHYLVVNFLADHTGSNVLKGVRYIREMCYAALDGHADLVIRNVRSGVNPNNCLYGARTPLHIAARHGRLKVAELLIEHGAAINAEDSDGRTPLMDAVMGGHQLMSRLLRFNRASLGSDILKDARVAAMYMATYASQGDITRLGLLVENGLSPDVADYDLRTAIHVAASDGMLMTASYLLENCKADANPVDRWGKTPLQDALNGDHVKVAIMLRAHGGTLGPKGDPELLEKLNHPNLPSVYDVKKVVNSLMRAQMQSGDKIRDVSVGGAGNELNHRVSCLLIQQVNSIRAEINELLESLNSIDAAIGPTLLMLVTSSENSDSQENTAEEVALVESSHQGEQMEAKQPTHIASQNSLVDLRDGIPSAFVKYILRIKTVLEPLHDFHVAFLSLHKPHLQVSHALEVIGGRDVDAQLMLQSMLENSDHDSVETLFSDHNSSFVSLLVSQKFAEALSSGRAHPFPGGEREDAMHEAVETAIEVFQSAWGMLSPDFEPNVDWNTLEQNPHLGAGVGALKVALAELGYAMHDQLNKVEFCHGLVHMAGIADPYVAEEDEEESGSEASGSEQSSHLPEEASDTGKSHEKNVVGERERASLVEDHKELVDSVMIVLDVAKDEIAGRDLQLSSIGFLQGLLLQAKDHIRFGQSLEATFAGLLFECALGATGDRSATHLDDYWMGIIGNVVLMLLERRYDKSPSRVKRLRQYFDAKISPSEVSVGRAEFVRELAPLLFDKEDSVKADDYHSVLNWRKLVFVIHPNSRFLGIWSVMNRSIGVYLFMDVPFRIAFHAFGCFNAWYLACNTLIECIQIVDVFFCFHTAYYNDNRVLVMDPTKIRKHYLSNGFFTDALATLPIDILMWGISNSFSRYPPSTHGILKPEITSWMRLPKMFLIVRFLRWQQKRIAAAGTRNLLSVLWRMIPSVFFLIHICACLWWMCGSYRYWRPHEMTYDGSGTSWINTYVGLGFKGNMLTDGDCVTQYMLSLYWVLATLTTNALIMGMYPTTWLEVAYTCLMMVITLTVFAYLLGEISNVVMEADEELVKQRHQLSIVTGFIQSRQLPPDLVESIMSQFSDLGRVETRDASIVFDKLSNSLQVEVARCTSKRVVERVPIMAGCNANFLDALVVLLRELELTRDSYLFRVHEVSDRLYFIAKGSIEFVEEEGNESIVTSESSEGEVVGELSFFFGMPQSSNSRSKLNNPGAMLYVLYREDFRELAKLYPEEEERIIKRVLAKHKDETALVEDNHPGENWGGKTSGLLQIQRSMEMAERQKHEAKVMEMISLASKGNLPSLKEIIKRYQIDVNETDTQQRTALHVAAANGHMPVTIWLVNQMGADVSALDINGISPLMEAVQHRHHGIIKFLQAKKVTLASEGREAEVCELAYHGNLEGLQLLLENGVSANVKDYDQRSPLHLAANQGHLEVVEYLVQQGANVNDKDSEDRTPTQEAVFRGHRNVVDLLLRHGGEIFSMEIAYKLCDLAAKDNYDAIKVLLESGVDVGMQDYDRRSALHLAASEESIMVSNYLLQRDGIDVNVLDRYGATPLDDAIRHGREIMQSMLRLRGGLRGADPALQEQHAISLRKTKEDQRHQMITLAIEGLDKTPEMIMLRECMRLRQLSDEMSGHMLHHCSAFHKMLREISRKARVKKEWTPSQSVRYRRMVDNVRYMLVESKAFERAAEAMLRSTDSLSASAYRLATGDVRQALNTTLFHVKKVVKLADAITTEGRKHRFNLPALRRPPVKKLLKLRFAQSVYNAATAIQAAVNQPGDPGAKPKGRMDKPRVTGLLATWQRDWRQLLDTQTRSSGWEAVQRKVGKGNRTGLELELASQDSLAE